METKRKQWDLELDQTKQILRQKLQQEKNNVTI